MSTTRYGTVELLNCPLSSDNEHQIKFDTLSDQLTYFQSLHGIVVSNYNLFKHENYIDIAVDYDSAILQNYLRIQNSSINTKWWYYFIEKFEYKGDAVTRLYLKLDVWQTWQFDVTFYKSFIERCHLSYDYMNSISDVPSPGTLEEKKTLQTNFTGGYFIFCNSDVTQADTTSSSQYDFKLGDFSVPSMVLFYREDQPSSMSMDLQKIGNNGYGDRINSAVYVPLCGGIGNLVVQTVNDYPVCTGTNYPDELMKQTVNFDISDIIADYQKTLSYPYSKIIVQDLTTGQTIELEPNKFDSTSISFEVQTTISETPTYRIIPLNYKGLTKAYNESLVIKCSTSLPTLNNNYAKYLMNNQNMNNLKMVGAGVGMAGSLMAGSAMGAYSSFESIANTMLQEQQAEKQPNQLTAIGDGAMERLLFQNGFKISFMGMDNDHLQSANNFWKMFGYPYKRLDIPPISLESGKYKFIKLQNANINGDIPQIDLNEIASIFEKGVTLWGSSNFRQYP